MKKVLSLGYQNCRQAWSRALWLVLLVCLATLYPVGITAQMVETGSLYGFLFGDEPGCEYDNWISHVSERIANPGFNAYAPWDRQTEGFGSFVLPDTLQSRQWDILSLSYTEGNWQAVQNSIDFAHFPYDLIDFLDTDTNRSYYLLREQLNRDYDDNGTPEPEDDEAGSFDLGWGLYIYNPEATNPIIVTAPHPNDDFIAVVMAWKAFTRLNARYLMIAGAGREVAFYGALYYSNNLSISDPSRNSAHPFNSIYRAAADDIRSLLTEQNSVLGREFSLQVHSYDTDGSPGYASCQVSAGSGQNCINLPTRDLSLTQPDLINAAGYVIHPAGTVDNSTPVLTTSYWAVYNSYYAVNFDDGVHHASISTNVNLPGYSQSSQMLYTLAGWNKFDVYDPFFHIEMDELPNCYPQNDSTLNWFYGYDYTTRTWNPEQRYSRTLQYYTPWVAALAAVLPTVFAMDDGFAPNAVQITAVGSGYPGPPVLYFTRQYEYDFMTYELELIQKRYLGNGVYAAMDTLHYDRQNNAILASQALNYWSDVVPTGYTYTVRIRARDKHNRISGYSNAMDVSYYGSEAMVDDLIFDRGHSDNDRIALRWTDPPQHVPFSGYRLYRQKSGEPLWTLLGNVISGIQYYYDTAFTQSDTMLVSYRLVLQGNNNQTVSSNTCTGWLRAFAAPAISTVQFVGHDGIFLSWLPVTTTLSGHPDLPDYYQVEIADNLQFENAQTDWVIAEIQSYTHHPAPDNVLPERLFFRVYGLCSTQIRHGNRSDFD